MNSEYSLVNLVHFFSLMRHVVGLRMHYSLWQEGCLFATQSESYVFIVFPEI